MDTTINNIDDELLAEIERSHIEAEKATKEARTYMQKAVARRYHCALHVEKAKQLHKQDLAGYCSKANITGEQVKGYISLHDAHQKRPALQDKRQLLLCGILESGKKQDAMRNVTPKRNTGLVNPIVTCTGKMSKSLARRPVTDYTAQEKQQIKVLLKPFIELDSKL